MKLPFSSTSNVSGLVDVKAYAAKRCLLGSMSSQQFVFPPPPPPPVPPQFTSTNIHHRGSSNGSGVSTRGRGNRSDRGFQGRGQGQGHAKFGSRGGNSNSGYQGVNGYPPSGSYPLPEYPSVQQSQHQANLNNGYHQHPSRYPPTVVAPSNNGVFYDNTKHSPQYLNSNLAPSSYSDNSLGYGTSYVAHNSRHYGAGPLRQDTPNQPIIQGHPIRIGFPGGHSDSYQQGHIKPQLFPPPISVGPPPSQFDSSANNRPSFRQPQSNLYNQRASANHLSSHRSRGQKRGYQDAFSRSPPSTKPVVKTQVAPAVPSFGIPLPIKPPVPSETVRKRKKKRRHNQLGLTPKTVEHESSEEDGNDVDEEAKLAVAAGFVSSETQPLQFTYKGRKSTLQSTSDIASWIEERKKRYPTKARIAEKAERARQVREELQAARRDKELLAKQKAEAREKEKADAKAARKADSKTKEAADTETKKESNSEGANHNIKKENNLEGPGANLKNEIKFEGADSSIKNEIDSERDSKDKSLTTNGRAEKAKLKAEKLQRQLQKVEKRAARAAAKAEKLRAEACRHEEVNQIKVPTMESTKVEGYESLGTAKIPTPNQGSEVASDAISLKDEDLERFSHGNGEVVLAGVDHREGGDVALDTLEKLPDPLTPTSQPCIQGTLELDQEHEPAANGKTLTKQASDGFMPFQDDLDSLVDSANPQKPGEVPIESNFLLPTLSSSSSPRSSETDSEDETTSSDGSTSAGSSSSAPDSQPSKRVKLDKVAPPKRGKKKAFCRGFVRNGRCKRGDACGFRHELPNRTNHGGRKNRRMVKPVQEENKRRGIGLFQRLVEQERALEAFEARTQLRKEGATVL